MRFLGQEIYAAQCKTCTHHQDILVAAEAQGKTNIAALQNNSAYGFLFDAAPDNFHAEIASHAKEGADTQDTSMVIMQWMAGQSHTVSSYGST